MQHYCILHIGKTAGTALKAVVAQHKAACPDAPIEVFKHDTSFPRLCTTHPDSGVVFFVRDPVERFVSGFNSRLRFGRPRYNNPWSESERQSFLRFPTANALGESLAPDDENWPAAQHAMHSIYHARFDLVHYLHSAEFLEAEKSRIIFIGTTETFDADLPLLQDGLDIDRAIMAPTDAISAHRNPDGQRRDLSSQAKTNLRRWYTRDYEIYHWCLAHRRVLLERIGRHQAAG